MSLKVFFCYLRDRYPISVQHLDLIRGFRLDSRRTKFVSTIKSQKKKETIERLIETRNLFQGVVMWNDLFEPEYPGRRWRSRLGCAIRAPVWPGRARLRGLSFDRQTTGDEWRPHNPARKQHRRTDWWILCMYSIEREKERETVISHPFVSSYTTTMSDYLRSCWGVPDVPPSPAAFPAIVDHRRLVRHPSFCYQCFCRHENKTKRELNTMNDERQFHDENLIPGTAVVTRSPLNHNFAGIQQIWYDSSVCIGPDDGLFVDRFFAVDSGPREGQQRSNSLDQTGAGVDVS